MAKRKLPGNFWECEMGAEIIETAKAWKVYLERHDYEQVGMMQARFEAFRISMRYVYGMDLYFSYTKDRCSIFVESENGINEVTL